MVDVPINKKEATMFDVTKSFVGQRVVGTQQLIGSTPTVDRIIESKNRTDDFLKKWARKFIDSKIRRYEVQTGDGVIHHYEFFLFNNGVWRFIQHKTTKL